MYNQTIEEENIEIELGTFCKIGGPSIVGSTNNEPMTLSDMHMHKEYEIIRLDSGNILCKLLDDEFSLNPGDIVFINPYVPHSTFATVANTSNSSIQFLPSNKQSSVLNYVARFTNSQRVSAYIFKADDTNSQEIQRYTDTIINEYVNRPSFWNKYIEGNLCLLTAALYRRNVISEPFLNNKGNLSKLLPVLEYIDENYDKDISTSTLCKIASFNETYFCKLFKYTVGTNPTNYINFVRVCKATQLFSENISLSDIIERTGFSSLSYFHRIFKRFNHCSPSEYRKIHIKPLDA